MTFKRAARGARTRNLHFLVGRTSRRHASRTGIPAVAEIPALRNEPWRNQPRAAAASVFASNAIPRPSI